MNTKLDWKLQVKLAARDAFVRALSEIGPTNLCGFALYTDESAMSLIASVNTEEHLKTMIAGDETESAYYRWSPPEWFKEWFADDLFDEVNGLLLADFNEHLDGSKSEIATDAFFEECVRARGTKNRATTRY